MRHQRYENWPNDPGHGYAGAVKPIHTHCSLLAALAIAASSVQADPGEPSRPSLASVEVRACERDEALAAAASRLLQNGEPPASEELTRAVRAAGSDAVSVRALWLSGNNGDEKLSQWLEAFRERADAPLVCGQASSPAGRLVIATARGGSLVLKGETPLQIQGRLERGFDEPQLVVSSADGRILRHRVDNAALGRGIALRSDLQPPVLIQLVASGRSGPRPVAERIAGDSADRDDIDGRKPEATADDPNAAELTFRLNRLRKRSGVLAVRDNRLLARLAARHAEAVCATGRAVHEIEPGLDPEKRLERAGLRARTVGESVARSSSATSAFDAMRDSPSHRMTMLDARFTDVGIGLASDANGYQCAVVLLAAWPRYVGK